MNEVYWGVYQSSTDVAGETLVQVVGDECVLPAEQVPAPDSILHCLDDCIGLGSGWLAYRDVLLTRFPGLRIRSDVYPQAKYLARLAQADLVAGKSVEAFQAHPIYLRNKVTQG